MTVSKRSSGLAPPTSDTFAPELSFTATSLRASLTPTSTALPYVSYDQTFVVAPTDQVLPELSDREQNRLSTGSVFSLSRFPLPLSIIEPDDNTVIHVPDHSLVLPMPDTPYLQQYPFRIGTTDRQSCPSPTSLIDLDEYDPEQPGLVFQTPVNVPSRTYQSACTTIPEESSVGSKGTMGHEQNRYEDSPPVSPKTNSPPRFTLNGQYNLPIQSTTIPEEESPRTIDPSVLTKDTFSLLTSNFSHYHGSTTHSLNSSRTSLAPPTPNLLDPLLAATFPPGPDSPTRSQTSSLYSSPTHSPHASLTTIGLHAPCSPRPAHASLPALSLNFTTIPYLPPGPRGPRQSPPKPLRSSIQQLRRMNSDASDARKDRAGRGERRYLRLGRESSFQVPGDESWLDDLEEYEGEGVELDDEEVRRLVGTVLESGDEEDDGDYDCDKTILDGDVDGDMDLTPRAAKALGGERGVAEEDAIAGAEKSESSLWDESDAFWSSSTPPPETGRPSVGAKSKKRQFEVAKDEPGTPKESPVLGHARSGRKHRDNYEVQSDRKRSVLGDGTPNVGARIQVTSPTMTPGSYYDEQGFLR
ncbi:hypothetical protein N0V91_001359 [Didymella pomorum]|uniref:Uncharacterized protein n=1 Tax=Didymella pomorum TaxID=749634 RepID=A0A9W9DAP2_9PLEO|nr:hypothetical protein N0V91_001359 [Didymella pomorum]